MPLRAALSIGCGLANWISLIIPLVIHDCLTTATVYAGLTGFILIPIGCVSGVSAIIRGDGLGGYIGLVLCLFSPFTLLLVATLWEFLMGII